LYLCIHFKDPSGNFTYLYLGNQLNKNLLTVDDGAHDVGGAEDGHRDDGQPEQFGDRVLKKRS
jgi:hypothetical protein